MPSSAHAHELPHERTLLVEISPEQIEAMVVYQHPPGRPVQFLVGRYDFDGDGKLKGAEARAAGDEWAPRVLQGLTFEAGGESLEPDDPKVKFQHHHNDALSAAVLLTWDRDDLATGATRSVHVRRANDAGNFTTLVRFQIRSGLTLVDAPGDTTKKRRIGPYELMPGDDVGVTVERHRKQPPKLPTARP